MAIIKTRAIQSVCEGLSHHDFPKRANGQTTQAPKTVSFGNLDDVERLKEKSSPFHR